MHVKVAWLAIRAERAAAGDSRAGGCKFNNYISEII